MHAGHVGMEVRNAVAQSHHRERVAHQPVAIECAQHFPSGMPGDHKHRRRLNLQVGLPPNLALKVHATMKFVEALAFPDDNPLAHLFVCTPLSSAECGFSSDLFAASHNSSIFSRGRSLNSRPVSRASLSMARNRRANFVLAFLSAISGSTFKNLERFTAAKSKSPNSSSVFK